MRIIAKVRYNYKTAIYMKRFFIWFLLLISLAALLLRYSNKMAELFLGVKQTAGISIFSEPSEASIFLDDKEIGKTPLEDKNLEVRDYFIRVEKGKASWQGKVKLTGGTVTIINRDLAEDPSQSAGEILKLDKGSGITVISNPESAEVEVDGKAYGKTPLTISLASGEHNLLVSHPNFLKRSIKARLPDQFNLIIHADLALSEADLTTISTPVIKETVEVLVKSTPTGFLRVRDKPSLNGEEIAQVKPKDKVILLEELGEWNRVRLPDNTEGYVASTYVEKIIP